MNSVNGTTPKANELKTYIEKSYSEFLNTYLPLINLYKLYLYKSVKVHSNDINYIINNFNFENFDYSINEKNIYNTNNYISNKKNIFEDTLSKLNKEIKILDDSIAIYKKGINFFFTKLKFNFGNSQIYNQNFHTIDNPFLISTKPKKFFGCIKQLNNHKVEIYSLKKMQVYYNK